MIYKEQLQQPEWHKKAALIKLRDNNCCTKCGSYSYLHVHHTYYKHGLLAWEYPDEALTTLCSVCHEELHKKEKIPIKRKPLPKKTKEQLALAKENRIDTKERLEISYATIREQGRVIEENRILERLAGKPRCIAIKLNGDQCSFAASTGNYCTAHSKKYPDNIQE